MHSVAAFLALSALLVACDAKRPDSGVAERPEARQDTIAALIERLRSTPGRFVLVLANRQYELEGKDSLLPPFAAFGDSAVVRLVACLDRDDPTRVTVEGRPVLLGALCHLALTYVAYAEPEGSESGDWPGDVFPTASAEQLRAAKAAWEQVVRTRAYRLN